MGIFDLVHNRQNTRSYKWDFLKTVFQTDDILPMWVADMDFRAPESVNEALMKRIEHGIYGYTVIDNDVHHSIINWISNRHKWTIDQSWITFSPGVVPSLNIAIQAFTKINDKILIQTPVYTPFYDIVNQHDRELVTSPLVYKDNRYQIDFDDFEENVKQGVKAFILCSPHNPVGRVWTRDELTEMARICLKHNVLILSDEIHSDLVFPGHHHIPIASISDAIAEQTITCMSPSKTFNLAGLQASYIITKNEVKRNKLEVEFKKIGINMLNTMGNIALEAAYTHGEPWLNGLLDILIDHRNYVIDQLESKTKELKVIRSEGTYLVWIDCTDLKLDAKALNEFMIQEAKVGLNAGVGYGVEGEQFMRINIACPQETLVEGVKRIINAVNNR